MTRKKTEKAITLAYTIGDMIINAISKRLMNGWFDNVVQFWKI